MSILEGCDYIDTLHSIPLKSAKTLADYFRIIKYLKSQPAYDKIIDLQGLIKSGVLAFFLSAKEKTGYDSKSAREALCSLFYDKKTSISYYENILARHLALLNRALDSSFSLQDIFKSAPFLKAAPLPESYSYLDDGKKKILIMIEASKDWKIYPKEQFAALINALEEDVYIIYHAHKEEARYIAENSKAKLLAPAPLDVAIRIIARMNLVIGGDTGITHMAWALKIPSITLFVDAIKARSCLDSPINKCLSGIDFDSEHPNIEKIPIDAILQTYKKLI